jgi:histone acetyltransferase HTATIP
MQYNLEKVKQKVSEAIVDRLPFIKDPLTVIDIASNVYDDEFPDTNGGLRRALVIQIDARLPAIVDDEGAWEEYSRNKTVMKALHVYQCNMRDDASSCFTLSTPVAPVKSNRKGRAQDRGSGE